VYLWRKKTKISSKILAAHVRNLCVHALTINIFGEEQ
jgi:hypothetical protein